MALRGDFSLSFGNIVVGTFGKDFILGALFLHSQCKTTINLRPTTLVGEFDETDLASHSRRILSDDLSGIIHRYRQVVSFDFAAVHRGLFSSCVVSL